MNNPTEVHPCCHSNAPDTPTPPVTSTLKQTTRSLPSISMSILIAFFPKCPFCWAIYMSMFSSVGLARLPYMPWLLPVLLSFLAIHLFLIYRKIPQKGYIPFAVSVLGAVIIISGKLSFPSQEWVPIPGMVLLISGSLLNNLGDALILNQIKNITKLYHHDK
ncbi:MAG: hypothetical protein ABI367_16310 [Mucilaginibacter sp.]